MPKVSIITTHWAMNGARSKVMRQSYESLFKTAPEAEIIVVDNGENLEDSQWLLEKAHQGKVACYIRNRKNMHFAYARNQAVRLCSGDYIVIADNDILYEPNWLEACLLFLTRHPDKLYLATPLACDPCNDRAVRWQGEVDGWRLNMRAGSNCFVISAQNFNEIGFFPIHRIAGSKWNDTFVRKGFLVAVCPQPMAFDMGLRQGYDLNKPVINFEL